MGTKSNKQSPEISWEFSIAPSLFEQSLISDDFIKEVEKILSSGKNELNQEVFYLVEYIKQEIEKSKKSLDSSRFEYS